MEIEKSAVKHEGRLRIGSREFLVDLLAQQMAGHALAGLCAHADSVNADTETIAKMAVELGRATAELLYDRASGRTD